MVHKAIDSQQSKRYLTTNTPRNLVVHDVVQLQKSPDKALQRGFLVNWMLLSVVDLRIVRCFQAANPYSVN